MKLNYLRVESLPRLAWCATLSRFSDSVEIVNGPWVENHPQFFCEGAWSGDFDSHEFESSMFMGSGGKLFGKKLLISTPNHTLERIFVIRRGRKLYISNSLPFILAQTNDSVSTRSLLYSEKLASITNGIRGYARFLQTRNGHRIRLYYHCNLLIDSSLRITEKPKNTVREFTSYADYKSYLSEQILAIHVNASDPKRQVQYKPITTISTGYDSPAAAVLARDAGCTEALTFANSRGEIADDTSDSGAEIAKVLGMRPHVFDRLDYLRAEGFPEAEFMGWGAQEYPWAQHLAARILFTGFHGDKVWDKLCKKVTPHIVRGDPSGHNLTSFRLRVGWIHLPVPFVGCTSHPSIHRISNSAEMSPWSTGNDYDRPIARRLVEEAGIQRHQFGQNKKAAGLILAEEGFRERMTRSSYEEFESYCSRYWNRWMVFKQHLFRMLRQLNYDQEAYGGHLTKLLEKKTGIHVRIPNFLPREIRIGLYGELDQLALLVQWSTEKLLPQYQIDNLLK